MVSGELHYPATLLLGNKPWYPLDGPLCKSRALRSKEHILPLSGIEPQPSSRVASRYTDWAIPACKLGLVHILKSQLWLDMRVALPTDRLVPITFYEATCTQNQKQKIQLKDPLFWNKIVGEPDFDMTFE
jgi:hypothetical protein